MVLERNILIVNFLRNFLFFIKHSNQTLNQAGQTPVPAGQKSGLRETGKTCLPQT
jgi:hypothetical protein